MQYLLEDLLEAATEAEPAPGTLGDQSAQGQGGKTHFKPSRGNTTTLVTKSLLSPF